MVRVRLVTTPIWSQEHLVAALAQVGFPEVESRPDAAALESWRGTPLGANAHVLVRRRHLGAASDDLGFARNAHGSFDLVLSEGHFFRFDRRWIEDVARRHDELARAAGRSAPGALPGWSKRDLDDPPQREVRGEPPPRPARADSALTAQHAQRARTETAHTLDALRKKQKKSDGPGCILSLAAPILVWMVLAAFEPAMRGGPGFFGVVMPLGFAILILRGMQMARRAKAAAAGLVERLPSSDVARAAAQEFLEGKVKPAGAKSEDALVKELLKALREPRT